MAVSKRVVHFAWEAFHRVYAQLQKYFVSYLCHDNTMNSRIRECWNRSWTLTSNQL